MDTENNGFIYLRGFDIDLWPLNQFIHIVYVQNYLFMYVKGHR